MATVRTLNWYESEVDAQLINANNWQLQIAKSVASASSSGKPLYNIIWQSQGPAPITQISWTEEYALGWTASVPSDGVRVSILGRWQPCNKGETYDINNLGYWTPSQEPREPGWLSVGKINYTHPKVLGIHIIVGVKNAISGRYEPIYVDRNALPEGSTAKYQPQETVTWWLESNNRSGQVFSTTRSNSTHQDFSNPSNPVTGDYEWSTSYVVAGNNSPNKWVIIPGAVAQAAPPPSATRPRDGIGGDEPQMILGGLSSFFVRFRTPLTGAALGATASALYDRLSSSYKQLNVYAEGKDGSTLRFEYHAGQDDPQHLIQSAMGGGPRVAIDNVLRDLQHENAIPSNITWDITMNDSGIQSAVAPEISNGPATSLVVQQQPPSYPIQTKSYQQSFSPNGYTNGFVNGATVVSRA
ncbi:hypothetical protein QBC47DRAFT_430456 [Echria macrotheca]|uniref:Uncharacterized protein n=1 Tax=Echria macrotheca TaxID=438768 RepID=A0AAJ0B8I1_9PEZI|nr:hypothetical protein QBC47DRAFT_430456 [Echria macrotheca]